MLISQKVSVSQFRSILHTTVWLLSGHVRHKTASKLYLQFRNVSNRTPSGRNISGGLHNYCCCGSVLGNSNFFRNLSLVNSSFPNWKGARGREEDVISNERGLWTTAVAINRNNETASSSTEQNLRRRMVERSNYNGLSRVRTSNNNNGPTEKVRERRTLDQVIYHLQADIRRRRRIHKAEVANAVELVEESSTVEDFGPFLLHCCCDILPDIVPENRVAFAQRIWAVVQKSKEYSVEIFEAMLKALAVNENKTADPFEFLKEAKEVAGLEVSATMYYFALLILCQRGDLEAVVNLLSDMKSNNLSVNERFFNVLITGNARSGDLKGAEEILEIMKRSNIEPSTQTWTSLLKAYIEAENFDLVRDTFAVIYGANLTEDQYYEFLKAAGQQSNKEILNLVAQKALDSTKMRYVNIMNVCVQLMYLGYCKNALDLVLKFKETLSVKKEPLGAFFIKELHGTNLDCESYLDLVMQLQREDRNPYALNMAAESCLKHKKLKLVYTVFEGMSVVGLPVRPHYFISPFLLELEQNGIGGSIQVLRRMYVMGVQPDWEMLLHWIIPKMFEVEDDILEVLKIVQSTTGVSYSTGLLSSGLAVTVANGRLDEAIKIVDTLKGRIINPEVIMQKLISHLTKLTEEDYSSLKQEGVEKDISKISKIIKYVADNIATDDKTDYVGTLMLKLIKSDRGDETKAILNRMHDLNIPISETVAEALKQKLMVEEGDVKVDSQLKCYPTTSNGLHTIHHKQMDLKALECHKEELEAKDLNARGVYRKLFLKHCQKHDLEKAIEVKEKFQSEFGELSTGMKSALMGNYIQNDLLPQALQLYNELSQIENGDRELDTYKVIDLATLLIRKGFKDEGIKLVDTEMLKSNNRNPQPGSVVRNIILLLKAIAKAESSEMDKKSVDNVFRLTELFLSKGIIQPTNPTLGPSIKVLILRGDLEAAVTRMEMYSEKYKLVPCLQELTYATLNNAKLLDRVIQCSFATKGLRESKRLLALAKSDVGDLDGAAIIFRELGDQLSFVSLLKQCEYLASSGDIDKLLNLIISLHKTERNYDCKKLYNVAIRSCQLKGDDDGLKKVLQNMEEYDQYVPESLKEFVKSKS